MVWRVMGMKIKVTVVPYVDKKEMVVWWKLNIFFEESWMDLIDELKVVIERSVAFAATNRAAITQPSSKKNYHYVDTQSK